MPAPPTTVPSVLELAPSYRIPIILVLAAVPILAVQPWLSLAIAFFGVFLFFQALTLRLEFAPEALIIYRNKTQLRCFPYQDWQNWRLFWPGFPILLYFREVKSIHFLPILFDARTLKICLEHWCPL